MPNFETFTKRMVPYSKSPFVTVQKRGTISLSASSFVLLGRPEAVELLYDAAERVIGIRAVDRDVEHAYPLRGTSAKRDDSTFMLSGMAFTKYYGIDTTVARRYTATMQDDVLCVDLKDEGTVVIGHRSKDRQTALSLLDGIETVDEDPDA